MEQSTIWQLGNSGCAKALFGCPWPGREGRKNAEGEAYDRRQRQTKWQDGKEKVLEEHLGSFPLSLLIERKKEKMVYGKVRGREKRE